MTENTKFANAQDLVRCCNDAIDFLFELNYQLTQVLEAKNRLYTQASLEMNFSRCQEISDSKSNLEKIITTLLPAISDINQIVQRIPKLAQNHIIDN